MSNKRTYVAVVLDRSGSMNDILDATINGVNEQQQAIRTGADKGGATFVSLWTFGGDPEFPFGNIPKVDTIFFNESVLRLVTLSRENYIPFGCTPMFDAVGQAIESLSYMDQSGDVGFLVIIVSDGMNNASKIWNSASVATKIQRLQATGKWTFAYIGANQDLSKIQADLGILRGNTLKYTATPVGTRAMYASAVAASSGYMDQRAMGVMTVDNFLDNNNITPVVVDINGKPAGK